MCYPACWPAHLTYRRNKRVIAAALAGCKLYEVHAAGGACHILTADWNVDDDDVDFCLDETNHDRPIDGLERDVLNRFKALSIPERYSALRLAEEKEPIPRVDVVSPPSRIIRV